MEIPTLAQLPTIQQIQAERTRRNLASFVEETSAWKLEPWQVQVCERLEKLREQKGQRILMHGPPQFGKSFIISQRFPAFILGNDPLARVRVACYNQEHATRFSIVNHRLMLEPSFIARFPHSAARVRATAKMDEWSTAGRDAQRDAQPSMRALGLGSGFTGLGVDLLIVDDPYKNRQEAFSATINEGIWDWWKEVVVSRLNSDTNVVVMFHRWKEDDLAGRLIEQGGWEQMRFPAIADGGENDPTDRIIGEPLSKRYSLEYLKTVQHSQGEAAFESLYQGNPRPRGGVLFKAEWLTGGKIVGAAPMGNEVNRVRYWDLAGSAAVTADYTVGVLIAKANGLYYIEDIARGQWTLAERKAQMRITAERDRAKYGENNPVRYWFEAPFGQGGQEMAQDIVRHLEGFSVRADHVTGDKVTRAEPFISQCEAANVRLCKADWNARYIDELLLFPHGKHDDQVDATSGAFNKLMRRTYADFDLSPKAMAGLKSLLAF